MKHIELIVYLMAFIAVGCTDGCSTKHSQTAQTAELKNFDQEEETSIATYMTGDVEHARQSLKQTIQLLKASIVLDAHSQSGRLYADYIRLYALESRTGNVTDSKEALMLAQYWRIRNLKIPEATNDADIIYAMSDTPEQILKYVDVLDAGGSGSRPKYLQFLTNSPTKAH